MSGLSYLCDYGESEESESEEPPKKLKLPVPDLSKVAVLPTEQHIDDPQLHDGRIRSFPHIRGNWATYAYIKYPDSDNINEVLEKFKHLLLKAVNEPCHITDNLHISVSKTFALKYHLIATFTTSIHEATRGIECFELGFDSVAIYTNEEKTRTFLALKADHFSHKYLLKISEKIDSVLEEFNLPKFYDDPSFHMSILWWNGNWMERLSEYVELLNEVLVKDGGIILRIVTVTKLDCKVGNKYYQFNLN